MLFATLQIDFFFPDILLHRINTSKSHALHFWSVISRKWKFYLEIHFFLLCLHRCSVHHTQTAYDKVLCSFWMRLHFHSKLSTMLSVWSECISNGMSAVIIAVIEFKGLYTEYVTFNLYIFDHSRINNHGYYLFSLNF